MSTKLNIGAGDTVIDGFTPIDKRLGHDALKLEYADNSVDEIRASHILEHFSFDDGGKALTEWLRVLKPGGRMRIAVPDFDKIDKSDPLWRHQLMGGQVDDDDMHKCVFDRKTLEAVLHGAGLKDIQPWTSENSDTASQKGSLNLEGIKSKDSITLKIAALMSIPRTGFNDSWGQVLDALSPFRIPVRRFQGAFWGQCMQNGMDLCIKDGINWVLCIDYDSMFTSKHVDTLMGELGNNPEIDALAAMQSRRSKPYPLMTVGEGETECVRTVKPIKVTTAHFGLTLIRLDVLKDIPKPWFFGRPSENGDWGPDRLDPDIWFWHQWRLAGKTIYVSTQAIIGHLEVMVTDFDGKMKHRISSVTEWRQREGLETPVPYDAAYNLSDKLAVTEFVEC